MSATITLKEAQEKLPELIGTLLPGQEVTIMDDQRPVAKLVGQRLRNPSPRVPGNCRGMITLAVEDDDHLKDFAEYMP